jgi:acyl dehydratase
MKDSHVVGKQGDNEVSDMAPSSQLSDRFSISDNDPLKWAALCKDYNFIHLSGLAAKAFGLLGKLAHRNCVAAAALQKATEADSCARCDCYLPKTHARRKQIQAQIWP